MTFALIMLLAIQTSVDQSAVEDDIWNQTPLKNVSEIDLPASALKGSWQPSNGLKLNDLSDLTDVPAASRQAANTVAKQLKPIGVCSVADYTLVSTDFPLNTITVRVFVFADAVKCKAWWTKKYQYDGWEKHYAQVQSDSALVVRSTQTNKTAMAFGNVWLTTHQLRLGDEHITAANHLLKLLTNGTKSLPQEATKTPTGKPTAPKTRNQEQTDRASG